MFQLSLILYTIRNYNFYIFQIQGNIAPIPAPSSGQVKQFLILFNIHWSLLRTVETHCWLINDNSVIFMFSFYWTSRIQWVSEHPNTLNLSQHPQPRKNNFPNILEQELFHQISLQFSLFISLLFFRTFLEFYLKYISNLHIFDASV